MSNGSKKHSDLEYAIEKMGLEQLESIRSVLTELPSLLQCWDVPRGMPSM